MPSKGRVGVVGLGLVGQAIASRLFGAGFEVAGYDQKPGLRCEGETVDSLAALDTPTVVLAVFDTADVEQVAAAIRPQLFIDCTAGDPRRVEALAARLASQGTGYVEAPLSGSSEAIRRGEALMLTAGAISACEAILNAISERRLHVGKVGMAARAKLATNLVLGLNRAALAEGMAFAEHLGIDRASFLELIKASPAASAAAVAKGEKMLRADWSAESRIRQHLKDVERMLEYAEALPLTQAHAGLLRDAVAAGDGDLDNAAIICRWRLQ